MNITIKTKAEIQGAINIISSSSIKIKNSNFDARTDNAILLDNSQSMIGKWSINITDCIFYNLNEDGSSIYLLDPTITIIDECNLKNIQSLVNLFRMELSSTKSLDLFLLSLINASQFIHQLLFSMTIQQLLHLGIVFFNNAIVEDLLQIKTMKLFSKNANSYQTQFVQTAHLFHLNPAKHRQF